MFVGSRPSLAVIAFLAAVIPIWAGLVSAERAPAPPHATTASKPGDGQQGGADRGHVNELAACQSRFRGPIFNYFNRKAADPALPTDQEWKDLLGVNRPTFLIATVPDPIDSGLSFYFDRTIEAIQAGIGAERWLRDQTWLPWYDVTAKAEDRAQSEECRRVVPGALIFRSPGAEDSESPQSSITARPLILLVVGETPTWGVHRDALRAAFDVLATAGASTAYVVGPSFSGTSRSLRSTVFDWYGSNAPKTLLVAFDFVSGTATNTDKDVDLTYGRKGGVPPTMSFRRTNIDDQRMTSSFFQYLEKGLGVQRERNRLQGVALLSETTTAYGQNLASRADKPDSDDSDLRPQLSLTFPPHISTLRSAYEKAGEHANQIPKGNIPLLELAPSLEEQRPPLDLPPHMSSRTKYADDMLIRDMLGEISRQNIRYLGLMATDISDVIFLAERVRAITPDVRLFTFGSEEMYLHAEYQSALQGTLVASPYPFYPFLGAERPDQTKGDGPSGPFLSDGSEALYRATRSLVAAATNPNAEQGGPASQPLRPWIGILNNGAYWPLAIMGLEKGSGAAEPSDAKSEPHRRLKPPRSWLFCVLAIELFIGCSALFVNMGQRRRPRRDTAVARLAPVFAHIYYPCEKWRLRREQQRFLLMAGSLLFAAIWFIDLCHLLHWPDPHNFWKGTRLLRMAEAWGAMALTLGVGVLVARLAARWAALVTLAEEWAAVEPKRADHDGHLTTETTDEYLGGWRGLAFVPLPFLLPLRGKIRSFLARHPHKADGDGAPPTDRRATRSIWRKWAFSQNDAADVEAALGAGTLILLAAFVGCTTCWFWQVRILGTETSALFLTRIINIGSGVSPAVPILLTLACLFAWTLGNLARLRILDSFYFQRGSEAGNISQTRPISQLLGVYWGDSAPALGGHGGADSKGATKPFAELEKLERLLVVALRRPWTVGGYRAGVAIIVGSLVAAFLTKSILTVESAVGTWVLTATLFIGFVAVVTTLLRTLLFWRLLRMFLIHLARHPAMSALTRIPASLQRPLSAQLKSRPFHAADLNVIVHLARRLVDCPNEVSAASSESVKAKLANLREFATDLVNEYGKEMGDYVSGNCTKSFPAVHTMDRLLQMSFVCSRAVMPFWTLSAPAKSGEKSTSGSYRPPPLLFSVHLGQTEGQLAAYAGGVATSAPFKSQAAPLLALADRVVREPASGAAPAETPSPARGLSSESVLDVYADRLEPASVAWLKLADEFIASQVAICVTAWLVRHFRHFAITLVIGSVWGVLVCGTYTFQPRRLMLTASWMTVMATFFVGILILVRLGKDEILSLVGHREKSQSALNMETIGRILAWGALPLFAMAASEYPELWRILTVWLEPFSKGLR